MSASWIKDDSFVPIKTVSEITKNGLVYNGILNISGVKISTVGIRTYPYDKVASHVVGYVQNVNAEDLKNIKMKAIIQLQSLEEVGLKRFMKNN